MTIKIKTTIGDIQKTVSSVTGSFGNKGDNMLGENNTSFFDLSPNEEKNGIRVVVSNGFQERDMIAPLVSSENFDSNFLVSIEHLSNICSKLPPEMEILFVIEDGRCYIKTKKAEYDLVSTTEHTLPKMDENAAEKTFNISETNIKFIFSQTAFAMARNDARYYLEGILLRADKESLTGVATNGHRLAMCKMSNKGPEEMLEAILPRTFVEQVDKLLQYTDNMAEVSIGDRNVSIKTNQFNMKTNIIEGKYPDWEKVIPKGCKWSLEINKEEFLAGIQRAMAISETSEDPISIKQMGDQLLFSVKNVSTNEDARAFVEAKSDGDGFEIGVNAAYLTEAATAVEAESIVLEMIDPTTALKIHGKNSKESLFLVMPIKL